MSLYLDTSEFHKTEPVTSLAYKPQLTLPPQLTRSQPVGTMENWRDDICRHGCWLQQAPRGQVSVPKGEATWS